MSKLYLVRHGKCDWNDTHVIGDADRPLTENGLVDAKKAADSLRDVIFDIAYTSHLQRARITAEVIMAYHLSKRLIVVPEFKERCDGIYQGQLRVELGDYFTETEFSYEKKFPEGESLRDVEGRTVPKLREILRENQGFDIVIVSHAHVMRTFHKFLTGCSGDEVASKQWENGRVYTYDIK